MEVITGMKHGTSAKAIRRSILSVRRRRYILERWVRWSSRLAVAGEVGDERAGVIVGALLPGLGGGGECALHVRAVAQVGRAERGEMCGG